MQLDDQGVEPLTVGEQCVLADIENRLGDTPQPGEEGEPGGAGDDVPASVKVVAGSGAFLIASALVLIAAVAAGPAPAVAVAVAYAASAAVLRGVLSRGRRGGGRRRR